MGDALRDSPTLTDVPIKPAVTCTHLALQIYGKGKSQFYEDLNRNPGGNVNKGHALFQKRYNQ